VTALHFTDSPEVAAAKRLLDDAKDRGFAFERTGPGADAPLLGVRESTDWVDEIVLAGFWQPESCFAVRRRRSSLVVPGGGLPEYRELCQRAGLSEVPSVIE
jgi:hypothetical protein